MANAFQKVNVRKPNSNTFDLGHDVKYSMEMGNLTPVLLQEVLPGDRFSLKTETLIRFAPLVAPVMHNISVFTHYFFVPNRILWDNWEDFISPDLSKEVPPTRPVIQTTGTSTLTEKGSLWDYFGLPVSPAGGDFGGNLNVSALPFAAYQAIYNEYYRDQNLQNEVDYKLSNAYQPQNTPFLTLRKRAWMHDYFTSALPFAQKGPSVDIPIEYEDMPIYYNGRNDAAGLEVILEDPGSNARVGVIPDIQSQGNNPDIGNESLYASTAQLSGQASINDLRVAMRLQEWFEKAARGGSRYVEQLLVHWSVKSSDARLNRPEFIGGTKNPVVISEVLQTSSSDETTPQANMAGHGISVNSGKSLRYYAEEHGYIIGIQSVMPRTAYQQGLPRHFNRKSWEDYAWPTFAHLGEQEILNQEVYFDISDGKNEDTFGYIPRYSEYRYTPSRVAGEFRDTLAYWHMGRIFESRPVLNASFIEADPRKDIFAVPSESQHLWCHSYNKVFVRRKLPKYGTPSL